MKYPRSALLLLSLLSFLLVSCIGIDTDIQIRANGSGTIALEYRIHRMIEAMGKMDGNERWLPVPVGRADFERSVSAISGLSLASYSESSNDKDLLIQATLSFDNLQALSNFLDSSGRSTELNRTNGSNTLILQLSQGGAALDPDLETLVVTLFKDYDFNMRIQVPGNPEMDFMDAVSAGSISVQGQSASLSIPVIDILRSDKEMRLRLSWQD